MVGEINKSEAFVDELGASPSTSKSKLKGKELESNKTRTLKLRDDKNPKKKGDKGDKGDKLKPSKKDLQNQSKDAQLQYLKVFHFPFCCILQLNAIQFK